MTNQEKSASETWGELLGKYITMTKTKSLSILYRSWPIFVVIIILTVYLFGIIHCFNFRELGENMTDEELRAMIDEFDKDGDGESKFPIMFAHIIS